MRKAGLLAGIVLAGVLGAAAARAEDGKAAMAAAGEGVFNANCHACHSADPSKNTFGPSLVGVVGRKAGAQPRFKYSKALEESGLTWTEDNLRLWIKDNTALVPQTRMRHVAITDKAQQDYLIAYLSSLK